MKIPGLFLLFLLVIGMTSCKEDKGGSLTLHFKAFYDGQPLPMFLTKPFTGLQQLQFTHLSFYVSDLSLLDGTKNVNLKDIELVDMSFNDLSSAEEGYTVHFNNVASGNYSGIKFGIGVPQDLNAKKPEDFTSNHPLSNPTNYWSGWDSFIFMKTEGRLDTLGNGTFDTGFAYHTGTDQLYRIFEGSFPIAITEGKDKVIEIDVDYQKVLEGIDIKSKPLNSNPKDSVQIKMLVQNLESALELIQ